MTNPAKPSASGSRLTIAELFPSGDVVGEWVFSLTALAEDLNVGLRPSKDAMAAGDLRALLFWQRHSVTRLYEARRLVTAARDISKVKEFAGSLLTSPPVGPDLVKAYTRPAPDALSQVEAMYAQLRHLSVHYSKVGSLELEDTLSTYAYLPAEMKISAWPDGTPDVAFGWVQAIRSMEVLGDIRKDDFLAEMRSSSMATANLAGAWLMVTPLAIGIYLRSREIDSGRLGDVSGWQPSDPGIKKLLKNHPPQGAQEPNDEDAL